MQYHDYYNNVEDSSFISPVKKNSFKPKAFTDEKKSLIDRDFSSPTKSSSNRSLGDRFISTRFGGKQDNMSLNYDTKSEIFSQNTSTFNAEMKQENQNQQMNGNQQDQNETNNQLNSQRQTDENQRIYQTLLQNQMLNIQNPHLIQNGYETSEIYDKQGTTDKSMTLSMAPPSSYNVLRFGHNQENINPNPYYLNPFAGFQDEDLLTAPYKQQRKIAKAPFKVLDAPALQDDFYLNLVDWSSQNTLAVGLGSCVYLWSATTSKVTKLYDLGENDSVTSVQWSNRGTSLAVGTHTGILQIWDAQKEKIVKSLAGHEGRIGTVAWNSNFLSTGSRDKSILHRDLRTKNDYEAKLIGHKQEVCGLKWSPDEQQLASGGNDNKLLVWSRQNSVQPQAKFCNHVAAVKAIAWSPHQHGLLCSGGGTADRTIRFWNTLSLQHLNKIETGSQVCNLIFSKNVNELVSTHGYSQNQIIVWKYPTMKRLATLTGHTFRVLYLAASPDGQTLVTGAGDETLRFWNIFPPQKQQKTLESQIVPTIQDMR